MSLVLEIGKKYPEITGNISEAFAAELKDAYEKNDFHDLILDFEGTKVINSMTMGIIFAFYQKLHEEGKSLKIINASERVQHLLRMVNLAELILE